MKWHIFAVIGILSLFHKEAASIPAFTDLKEAFNIAQNIVNVIRGAKSGFDMMKELTGQTSTIDSVKKILLDRLDHLEVNIPEDIQQAAQIDGDLREMFDQMGDINFLYKSYYLQYLNHDISNASLKDFVNKATSIHGDGPNRRITQIFNIICPGELAVVKGSFLDRAVEQLNTRTHHRCRKFKSPQLYIYELWTLIATIEFRTFVMTTTAYKLRSTATEEDNELDIGRMNNEHGERMRQYLTSVKGALSQAITNVTRCKPTYLPNFEAGKDKAKFISLNWVISDYCYNKVITGVRFVVVDRILQIQVEDGKLLAGGEIEADSVRWVPVNVRFDSKTGKVLWNVTATGFVELVDMVGYHEDWWFSMATFHHADIIETCTDCALVGVKIQVHQVFETYTYYLDLRYAKFDIKTGVISCNEVHVKRAYFNDPDKEYEMMVNEKPTIIAHMANENKAYLDSNSLYTEPRLPLAGIGIYPAPDPDHKTAISFRIFNRDLATKFKTEL